jgi:DICT domain-containing protein
MSQPPVEIPLRTARVVVLSEGVATYFREDDSVAVAEVRWGDEDHIKAAWHAGYGGDQLRMLVEHEIAHSFVADEMGWPHSWSLWSAAHGTGDKRPMTEWSPRVRDEEHLVVALQRYANTGIEDEYGKLREAFGEALPSVARRFVGLARPWLQIRHD